MSFWRTGIFSCWKTTTHCFPLLSSGRSATKGTIEAASVLSTTFPVLINRIKQNCLGTILHKAKIVLEFWISWMCVTQRSNETFSISNLNISLDCFGTPALHDSPPQWRLCLVRVAVNAYFRSMTICKYASSLPLLEALPGRERTSAELQSQKHP